MYRSFKLPKALFLPIWSSASLLIVQLNEISARPQSVYECPILIDRLQSISPSMHVHKVIYVNEKLNINYLAPNDIWIVHVHIHSRLYLDICYNPTHNTHTHTHSLICYGYDFSIFICNVVHLFNGLACSRLPSIQSNYLPRFLLAVQRACRQTISVQIS